MNARHLGLALAAVALAVPAGARAGSGHGHRGGAAAAASARPASDCAPCAAAAAAAMPPLAIAPSAQFAEADWAAEPSSQIPGYGACGPCYPPGDGRPCYPQMPPQWITVDCPQPATPQSQLLGSSQLGGPAGPSCPPQMPACCGQPSFYCPPILLPATPMPKLQMGYKVPMMRAIRVQPSGPSYQMPPMGGPSGQLGRATSRAGATR